MFAQLEVPGKSVRYLLSIAALFGYVQCTAQAAQPTLEYGEVVKASDKMKHSGAEWLGKQIRLISEEPGISQHGYYLGCAANVVDVNCRPGGQEQPVKRISFEYRKRERGVIFKGTTDPVLCLEIRPKLDDAAKYVSIPLSRMSLKSAADKYTRATFDVASNLSAEDRLSIVRIAIVGAAKEGAVVNDYADADIANVLVDDAPPAKRDLELRFYKLDRLFRPS